MNNTETPSPRQLTLGVERDDEATLDNFYVPPGGANDQALHSVQALSSDKAEPYLYVWGAPGTGVSHLLQAACHHLESQGASVIYLPLGGLREYDPKAVLQQLEWLDLICLDDVDSVMGSELWEVELFALFNQLKDLGRTLLVGAQCGPHGLACRLPDLASRLQSGLTCHLQALSDEDKALALQHRAQRLGMPMSEEASRYMVSHYSRHPVQLFGSLQRLGKATLEQKKRLTIPFIKRVLQD